MDKDVYIVLFSICVATAAISFSNIVDNSAPYHYFYFVIFIFTQVRFFRGNKKLAETIEKLVSSKIVTSTDNLFRNDYYFGIVSTLVWILAASKLPVPKLFLGLIGLAILVDNLWIGLTYIELSRQLSRLVTMSKKENFNNFLATLKSWIYIDFFGGFSILFFAFVNSFSSELQPFVSLNVFKTSAYWGIFTLVLCQLIDHALNARRFYRFYRA